MKRFVGAGNVRVSAVCLPARCSHTDSILGRAVRCPAPCAPFKAVCPAHSFPTPPKVDEFGAAMKMCLSGLESERKRRAS